MTPKFSPGPWRIISGREGKGFYYLSNESGTLGHFGATIAPETPHEANTHLIAAAPCLYEALKGFITYHSGHVLTCPELLARMKSGYAALEKAEGNTK